jgi:uncharacterized protein
MKVVIDTNVLVSALLKNRIPEQVILFIAENDGYKWLVSSEILAEYKAVIVRPKFELPKEILEQWFTAFDLLTTTIDVDIAVEFVRDRKDAKFLACAIAGSANFLITGDQDFIEAQKMLETTVISVAEFNRLVFR